MSCSYGGCQEDPFLHWISALDVDQAEIETSFACTRHVVMLRHWPPIIIDGVTQAHEISSECLDEESSWDLDENCCTLAELDPIEDPELVFYHPR